MLPTREEIAELLRRAEGNRQKTQEILRDLERLMVYIDWILATHKPPKNLIALGKTHNSAEASPDSRVSQTVQ